MSWMCKLKHKWNGCQCVRCGQKREIGHDWKNCRCIMCGKERDEQHAWLHCCCKICGVNRDQQHQLNDKCQCQVCNKIIHEYDTTFICIKCGKKMEKEEIAKAILESYLLGGVITRIGRTIIGSGLDYLQRNDSLKILARWRNLIISVLISAQEESPEELKSLAQSLQNSFIVTEGKLVHRLWAIEARQHIEHFLNDTWVQGREASSKEIEDVACIAVSLVGNGLSLTRSQGIIFIKEIASCIEGKYDLIETTMKDILKHFEYDTLGVTCDLSPLLTQCTSQSFRGFEKSFKFDLDKEIAFQNAHI